MAEPNRIRGGDVGSGQKATTFDENGGAIQRLYTVPLSAVIVAMAVDVIKSFLVVEKREKREK